MKILLSSALLLLLLPLSVAQLSPMPPPKVRTVDVIVGESPRVFVGKVVDVPAPNQWPLVVGIQVTETLRGEVAQQIRVAADYPNDKIEDWKKIGARLLIATGLSEEKPAEIIDLSDSRSAILNGDLKVLRGAEAILREVRRAVEAHRGKSAPKTFSLLVGEDKVAGTYLAPGDGWYSPPGFINAVLPIDEILENVARARLNSDKNLLRINGIQALGNFPTEENKKLILPLLADAGWEDVEYARNHRIFHLQYNNVRRTAFDVLQSHFRAGVNRPETVRPNNENEQVLTVELDAEPFHKSQIDELSLYPNVQDIYLSNANLSPDDVAKIGRLKKLRRLFLEGSNVSDAHLKKLTTLPHLVYLGLSNTAVTDAGLLTLIKIKSLKKVDLGQRVTDAGIRGARELRPDLALVKDEFAFLAPFQRRRIDLPFETMRNYVLPVGMALRQALGLRVYAVVIPADRTTKVRELLATELPKRGWKIANERIPNEYTRPGIPIILDKVRNHVDEVRILPADKYENWPGVTLAPGEIAVIVSRNVDPVMDK